MLNLSFKYKSLLVLFCLVLLTALWPNNIYLLVLFSFLTYIVLPIRTGWSGMTLLILLFSLFYSCMVLMTNQSESGFVLIAYLIAPVAFFRYGTWLMHAFNSDLKRQQLLFIFILCYLSSLFVATIKDINSAGLINFSRVMSSSSSPLAATLYGLMASLGIACVASVFASEQNKWLRIGFILLSILSLLVVIHLVNRTGLIIFVCCLLSSLLIHFKRNVIRILPYLVFIALIVLILFNTQGWLDNVFNAYTDRELQSSHSVRDMGGRIDIWRDAFYKLLSHPFGWEKQQYAHNLWLDVAGTGGWLSVFLILLPSAIWIKKTRYLMRTQTSPFILLLISINISIFLSALVEPIIDGSILYFSLFIMFCAITICVSNRTVVQKL